MLDLETFERRAGYKFKPSTLRRKIINLSIFKRFLEENNLKLNEESIVKFLDHLMSKGYSPGAIRNMFYDIQSYCKLMLVDIDLEKVRELVPPLVVPEAPWLRPDEVRALLNISDPVMRCAIAIMYAYARRPGEVLQLQWSDIDFARKRIRFRILKKRLGRDEYAEYDLEDWIAILLNQLPREGERVFNISQKHFNRKFRKLAQLILGKKVTPHILRHSRITHLRQAGVPIDVVSKHVARHAKIETTIRIYRHVSEEEVREIPKAKEMLFTGERA